VLVLIPTIGTRRTLLVCAVVLAASALPMLPRRAVVVPLVLVVAVALPPGAVKAASDGRVVFETDSAYQFVQVVRRPDGSTVLHLNEGWAVHSILPARGVLTGGYWDAFLALPLLTGRPAGRLAVLGNAGGTVANLYGAAWPATRIDGVEIDPLVSSVGRRYLGMRNPRLSVHTADARFWLSQTRRTFTEIVVDAYRQPYIPFHLVSREFFQLVRRRLAPGGVVAINVGTPPHLIGLVGWIARTMRSVFPVVVASRYDAFNSIVIGFRDAASARRIATLASRPPGLAATPAALLAATLRPVAPGGGILTDDHTPIELLTDRALLAYLQQGAPGA
jgi:spermidine synthase